VGSRGLSGPLSERRRVRISCSGRDEHAEGFRGVRGHVSPVSSNTPTNRSLHTLYRQSRAETNCAEATQAASNRSQDRGGTLQRQRSRTHPPSQGRQTSVVRSVTTPYSAAATDSGGASPSYREAKLARNRVPGAGPSPAPHLGRAPGKLDSLTFGNAADRDGVARGSGNADQVRERRRLRLDAGRQEFGQRPVGQRAVGTDDDVDGARSPVGWLSSPRPSAVNSDVSGVHRERRGVRDAGSRQRRHRTGARTAGVGHGDAGQQRRARRLRSPRPGVVRRGSRPGRSGRSRRAR